MVSEDLVPSLLALLMWANTDKTVYSWHLLGSQRRKGWRWCQCVPFKATASSCVQLSPTFQEPLNFQLINGLIPLIQLNLNSPTISIWESKVKIWAFECKLFSLSHLQFKFCNYQVKPGVGCCKVEFWTHQSYCSLEFTVTVVVCTRHAHDQGSQTSKVDWQGAPKMPLTAEELRQLKTAGIGRVSFHQGTGACQVAHVPVNDPISMHIWTVLIASSGLWKEVMLFWGKYGDGIWEGGCCIIYFINIYGILKE